MRRRLVLALLATFSWIGGPGQDARAGVTFDIVFQDATSPTGLTIVPGDQGPGCVFGGYYHRVQPTGRCMDVVVMSTDDLVGSSMSVAYDSDEGLELVNMYEWMGVGVSFNKLGTLQKSCVSTGGLEDNGGVLQSFDCSIPEPSNPPVLAAGTYKVGTIVWDASCLVRHGEGGALAVVAAYIDDAVDAVNAVRNGNVVDISDEVVLRSHVLDILGGWSEVCGDCIVEGEEACDDGDATSGDGCDASCEVEPGWTCEGEPSVCTEDSTPVPSMSATGVAVLGAAVFGIGVVGLVIAARRRFD